jgi:hypothetical protein
VEAIRAARAEDPDAMLTTAVISARPAVRWAPPLTRAAPRRRHPRPDEAGDDADRDALGRRQRQQVAPPRARARSRARSRRSRSLVPSAARWRPRGHERSRDGEQDVERLGMQGVPAAVLSESERLSTNCTWPGSERSTRKRV